MNAVPLKLKQVKAVLKAEHVRQVLIKLLKIAL